MNEETQGIQELSSRATGMVYLVGAGPGDPGLITVKGLECIRKSDVVIADYLADEKLLEESPPHAERIHVPWRPGRQEEINDAMAYLSRLCLALQRQSRFQLTLASP